jgi:hypothetical protein
MVLINGSFFSNLKALGLLWQKFLVVGSHICGYSLSQGSQGLLMAYSMESGGVRFGDA